MSEVVQREAKAKKDGRAVKKGGSTVVKKKVVKKTKTPTKKSSAKLAAPAPAAPKPKKGKDTYNKFEQVAVDAININATKTNPFVSFTTIRQYAVDYLEKVKVGSISKFVKKALFGLEIKKIIKSKKDCYAFAAAGKALAGIKVPERKKVVRGPKKRGKTPKVEVTIANQIVTTTGRTSLPVVVT
jgi:hypothetical protein